MLWTAVQGWKPLLMMTMTMLLLPPPPLLLLELQQLEKQGAQDGE